MRVKLKVLVGKKAGKELSIPDDVFVIGRSEGCHLRPKSDSISRRHCQITINGDSVSVRDLGSKNGTLVNDERIEEHRLDAGDRLRVGKLEFEVVIESAQKAEKQPEETVQERVNQPQRVAVDPRAASKPADHGTTRISDSGSLFDDSEVGDWLDEGDEIDRTRRLSDPDTKQFLLDQTERVELEKAQDDQSDQDSTDDDTSIGEKNKKSKPGKLPKPPTVQTDNSREAAADMLKRFFNRR